MRPTLTRRGFLVVLGGTAAALSIGVAPKPADASTPFQPNVWVRLDPDGTLTVTCARSEMGQGVRATSPYVIASELGADLSRVQILQAPAGKEYGFQNTDGSTSMRMLYTSLREAGAVARAVLVAAAAAEWGVSEDSLIAQNHVVKERSGSRSIGFGDLAAKAATMSVPGSVPLRPSEELVGVRDEMPFADAEGFVRGTIEYGADHQLPGMLTAVVARPPDLGATVASMYEKAARAVPGVVAVVPLPKWKDPGQFSPVGGVAVVAKHTWAAMKGREALGVTWTPGDRGEVNTEDEYAAMTASLDGKTHSRRKKGNAVKALAGAAEVVSHDYRVPHLEHAMMEPLAAVAAYSKDACMIWAPTQAPRRTQQTVAKAVGLPAKKVTVHVTHLGGAFGRKGKPDFVVEAALLSKAVGQPVRIQWTREDCMKHGYYHACAIQRLEAGFDGSGQLVAWRHRVAAPTIASTLVGFLETLLSMEMGMGLLDFALDVPDVSMEAVKTPNKVRIGWLRSVYNINHGFATQCFVDELARVRKVSTPDMLKTIIGPPRLLTSKETGGKIWNYGTSLKEHPVDVGRWHGVIDRVRQNSQYDGDPGEGRAFGFAAHLSFNTYVSVVVAVMKDALGRPKVDEAWVVVDPGQAINPDRVRAQMEGAVVFGISIALRGNITLKNGAVLQSNFHDYPVARMDQAPRAIHVDVMETGGPPGGIGEPGVPPVAPAICNAWATLTGERVRELPILKG